MKPCLLALSLISFGALGQIADKVRVPQPPVELGESWTEADVENVDTVLHFMRKKLVEDTGHSPLMRRDAHPKHHGCVKANLTIDNKDLAPELRVGLFEKNASYGSLIRFSNGDPNHKKADVKGDARGMAVKILGVPSENYLARAGVEASSSAHDLLFMNSPNFFVNDTGMYAGLMEAFYKGGMHVAWFGVTHPRMLAILARTSQMKVYNPLDPDYHSATPYKLGPTSMRMKFESCKTEKDLRPNSPADNYLSQRLADHLKSKSSCFDFYVQPNKDPKVNDIENPMGLWDTDESPLIKVGRLEIPVQAGIHSVARNEFCENVSFNPWRAPEANRPLGAMNRTRLEVYVKQAQFRQDHNKVADPMPNDLKDIP